MINCADFSVGEANGAAKSAAGVVDPGSGQDVIPGQETK
ncbi:unnamed protein product [Schistosoma mattheei]|uniref:Uncharacterized protein n=1 Tax=Schistosoma mattheei TaxID=31246 RepID=A0A3P7XUS2_9TREM|nr:unnamed protein product [Schistosoma mattheei]